MPPILLEILVLCLGLSLLLIESFWGGKEKRGLAWLGAFVLAGLFAASFAVVPGAAPGAGATGFPVFYAVDPQALLFKRFALLATLLVLVMAAEFQPALARGVEPLHPEAGFGEFLALPVLCCAGLMWMASAFDLIMLFVALELVTVCFYVMVAFMRRSQASVEAGTKYLVLSALSTGFLLYGIAWIFGVTGKTSFAGLQEYASTVEGMPLHLLFGVLLVGIAVGFKIAAAPFQFWVPDVYQGAPTPVTALLSVGSKALGFLVLLRLLDACRPSAPLHAQLMNGTAILAGLTLVYGNLAALPQNNLKRLLAYSSIAHAGYLLVGIAAGAPVAVGFYLGVYLLMTLLAFLVLTVVSVSAGGDDLLHFNGLSTRSPLLSFAMLVAMLSLAGLPLTAGFIGKLLVFGEAVRTGHFVLVGIGAVAVACGFYYYLKVVRSMYWRDAEPAAEAIEVSAITRGVILALVGLILLLGIWPEPLMGLCR